MRNTKNRIQEQQNNSDEISNLILAVITNYDYTILFVRVYKTLSDLAWPKYKENIIRNNRYDPWEKFLSCLLFSSKVSSLDKGSRQKFDQWFITNFFHNYYTNHVILITNRYLKWGVYRCTLTSHTSTQGAVFLFATSSAWSSSSESFSSSHLIRLNIRRLNFFTAFGPPSTMTILISLYRRAHPVDRANFGKKKTITITTKTKKEENQTLPSRLKCRLSHWISLSNDLKPNHWVNLGHRRKFLR